MTTDKSRRLPNPLDDLVETSRLIGADPDLVVHGGGNTSVKVEETDHLGRKRLVLRVKGSGTDLASISAADFPGLILEELLSLRQRSDMTDDEMSDFLRCCMIGGAAGPAPSIETLLHAFVPARFVTHVHADAICALTNNSDGDTHVRKALGSDVAVLPWIRPGFRLSRMVADAAESSRAVVLEHHGLVTWGEHADDALRMTREMVDIAEGYLRACGGRRQQDLLPDLPASESESMLLAIRGRLSRDEHRVIHADKSSRFLSDRADVATLATAGPATADHLLRTRPWSVVIRRADEVEKTVDELVNRYEAFVQRFADPPADKRRRPEPAIVLVPGVGVLAAGRTAREAAIAGDCAWHSLRVAADVIDAFGSLDVLPDQDLFDIEYWPMELAKLGRAQSRELDGRVYVVTGAASGIGREISQDLSARGAHLVLSDLNATGLEETADLLPDAPAEPELVVGDLRDERVVDAVVSSAVWRFGGIDGAVSNAGVAMTGSLDEVPAGQWRESLDINLTTHFLMTKRLLPALTRQGIGGSLVFVASKNAFAPGAEFGAYSVAKAAQVQLARMTAIEGGPKGIRANVVSPDAVFSGSNLWSESLRTSRAEVHGVAVSDLEDFYAKRNLLGAKVTGHNVAEAVAFLLSDRSERTTGCVITVDGGLVGGFPR